LSSTQAHSGDDARCAAYQYGHYRKFGLDPADMPMKPMSVEQCVSEALRHFRRGRSLSLPGALNRFFMGIMPAKLMRVMMGKMIEQTLAKNARREAQAAR
jgi:hypothetical protein